MLSTHFQPKDEIFALVDCNNFYASCERVFNPQLNNQPVIVLSNNDGCVVARSEEAKAVGIKMGQPLFECKDLVNKHNVRVFSSNYVLYGDMSNRVMEVLADFSPNIEIYSIDEAFLLFKGFENYNLTEYGHKIRNTVRKHTGIPVSVGFAKTKTLAKVANFLAKRVYKTGVFCLLDNVDEFLKNFPVDEIWGIGRQRSKWLSGQGIQSAYDFKSMSDQQIKTKMSITGLRTVWELRGISCLRLDEINPDKKAIGCSRSFGYEIETLSDLEEAICAYIGRGCIKLRKQNSLVGYLHVFIETNRFKGEYYNNSLGMYINPPSAYTPLLCHYSKLLLKNIFKPGLKYKRAGILLTDLTNGNSGQNYFISPIYENSRFEQIMKVMDKYNSQISHNVIHFAAEGLGKPWTMKQTRKSPRYTTKWNELLRVN